MKVRNMFTVKEEPKNYKTFKGVSLAVPDQTMSLQEILSRYARGLNIDGEKQPIWDEEGLSMGINPKTLDLVDIQRLKAENKTEVEELSKSVRGMSDRGRKDDGAKQSKSEKTDDTQQ